MPVGASGGLLSNEAGQVNFTRDWPVQFAWSTRTVWLPEPMQNVPGTLLPELSPVFVHLFTFRMPSTYNRRPSVPDRRYSKQPPEPKSLVSDQRTPKLFVAIPESGAPV